MRYKALHPVHFLGLKNGITHLNIEKIAVASVQPLGCLQILNFANVVDNMQERAYLKHSHLKHLNDRNYSESAKLALASFAFDLGQ